ncbi:Demethylmenaquinone methyltransferase [bacterium HR40]|nr:Demethylmenaquinone methyltransferase [bacterium HR40]
MPSLGEIKRKQQQTWSSGDYSKVAWITQPLAEVVCEEVDLRPGSRVLDVATGTGHVALAAARRFCEATGLDYVPALLEVGRQRAAAEGLRVEFVEGDAEDLPFPDDTFDYVLSAIGVMFAPDQPKAASELLRVCRPGGTVGVLSWQPKGYLGELFALIGRYVPPPPELRPAALWGTEERVRELFGTGASQLSFRQGAHTHRFPSVDHYVDFFLSYYGPTHKAAQALDAKSRESFAADIAALVGRYNRARNGAAVWPVDYLLAIAVKA